VTELYQSIDVLIFRRIKALRHSTDSALVQIGNATGKDTRDRRMETPDMRLSLEVTLVTRAEIDDFKAFLDTRCGRLVPFWLPAWDYELHSKSSMVYPSANLNFDRTEFVDAYLHSAALHHKRKFLWFWISDADHYADYISAAATVDADTEQVTMHTAVDYEYPLICFLNYCRLDADRIEIVYEGNDLARCVLPVKILQYDAIT